jgi:hypothetical protein
MHAEDAERKAADDTARKTNSGQYVQDEQDNGQNMNEDPDSVQPVQQDFRYDWKFVPLQLRNAKGVEIFYPVNDDWDREWAKRLQWAIEKHRDFAQDDMDKPQKDYEDALHQSKPPRKRTSGNTTNTISIICTSALIRQNRPSELIVVRIYGLREWSIASAGIKIMVETLSYIISYHHRRLTG